MSVRIWSATSTQHSSVALSLGSLDAVDSRRETRYLIDEVAARLFLVACVCSVERCTGVRRACPCPALSPGAAYRQSLGCDDRRLVRAGGRPPQKVGWRAAELSQCRGESAHCGAPSLSTKGCRRRIELLFTGLPPPPFRLDRSRCTPSPAVVAFSSAGSQSLRQRHMS